MKISDKELLEAYYTALQLGLDQDFIQMLEEQIEKRNIKFDEKRFAQK